MKGKNFPFKSLYYNSVIVLRGTALRCPGAALLCFGEDAAGAEQGGRKDRS